MVSSRQRHSRFFPLGHMNDFEGFEIPEVSDEDMMEMMNAPTDLGAANAENPGMVKGPFNQYVPADRMVGDVTAREYYGGNQSSKRQIQARASEEGMGPLKPIMQFMNSIMSPGFGEGLATGVPNALSNLGNAIGDRLQGKEVDLSDAWQITPQAAAAANPIRAIGGDTDITPQDEGGRAWGEFASGELAGVATGTAILNKVSKIPALVRLGQAALKTQTARNIAVKAATDRRVRGAVNFTRFGGEALFDGALSTVFQDPRGNLLNLGDAVGLDLPGRYDEETDNYLDAMGKAFVIDGLATPLALIGAGAAVPFTRRLATQGDLPQFMQDMADVELAPYRPSNTPLLPAATSPIPVDPIPTGDRSLPATGQTNFDYGRFEAGPGSVSGTFDSAISRTTSDQRMIQQVEAQRTRLEGMGLQVRQGTGQYELSFPGSVDPEVKLQVRAQQVERGKLLKLAEEGQDVSEQLAQVDQSITNLISGGVEGEIPPLQVELPFQDAPDPRPELSTFLAELDELDDAQLRQILPNVDVNEKMAARQGELEGVQTRITEVQQQIEEVGQRIELPDGTKKKLSATGAKRKLNPLNRELEQLQASLQRLEAEPLNPLLVGDQLNLAMDQQKVLSLFPSTEIEMPPFFDMEWDEAAGMYRTPKSPQGYASVDAYREALQKFPRDLLRKMNAPMEVSGDGRIAAILKARTGNRVWSAKKDDIIDSMVEFAQRQGKFLEPVGEQLEFQVQQSLPFNSLRQAVDVDGNPVVDFIPPEFPGGPGIDAAQREDFKRRILEAAINNGEVQPDITPIPTKVPQPEFNQSDFIDSLFADETGQLPMMFANDQLPVYKAGGRSAESTLEEIRLRYDWAELDNASKQASKEALMKKKGWDKMTWEEKKQAGIMDPFLYSMPTRERTYTGVTQTLAADLIGTADPNAAVLPPRDAKTYRWKPDGNVPEEVAKAADQVDQPVDPPVETATAQAVDPAPAKKKPAKQTRRQKQQAKQQASIQETERKQARRKANKLIKDIDRNNAEMDDKLAKLKKQQELNCNG